MKYRLLFILVIINSSCINKSAQMKLISDDYYFPESQIGFGKTMVYENNKTRDTTYTDLFHKEKLLVQCAYDKNSTSDSAIFLDYKFVDYYINPYGKGELWKANRILDTVILDEKGKLNEIAEFRWDKDSKYVFVKSRTEIVKDTIFQWHNETYPALITNTIIETSSNFLRAPDGNNNFKMEMTNYLCKHIGSIKRFLFVNWKKDTSIRNLIEIRDIKKK